MHGLSRLGSARSTTSSPPSSPRFRHGRNKNIAGSRVGSGGGKQNLVEKLVVVLISAVFKRKGVLLVAPLLYISVMLLYMSSFGFDVVDLKSVVVVRKRAPPGSVYRSPQVFQKLWPFMQAQAIANNTVQL